MPDIKYDEDKLNKEAQHFMDVYRAKFKSIADEMLGELYVNILPYLKSDTWTNYREALRLELEHEYKYSIFKDRWAENFRRAVFVENREEMVKLLDQDIYRRLKHLEDCRQEFEQFRYSPTGDRYQDIKKKLDKYIKKYGEIETQEEG